ncbi:indolepyruvate/phenylpyruvate decarboxylase [Geothrix limicola]|uniref:Indolepyruvate/phenylpyruvate decarboxylase n=1 Tax=Geothrix limicola TaxID=2927978 RepID=A0ABQ5QDN9_9BACT|nr:indolepyruvate/phenylpyruvate decarboxylase [Geothrix limicola]GLH72752.1 indolepyruvate/phenylpyruvate decarboxylase [Geothrix limicola]
MKLGEALLQALKARGAGEVFGIPGDFALPFFRCMEESAILPLFTFSHEPAVGFAADAAARVRGGLGVAAVTYGAGAFNLVNPIAQAYSEKTPLVVISGAPSRQERSSGLLLHHQAKALDSQMRVFQEITCDQAVLDDPRTAPALIARVLRSCAEYSRPVYLELPRDMVDVEVGPVPDLAPTPFNAEAMTACAAEILARLKAAKHPVLLPGVEVRRQGLESRVAELARRLGIPVATTFLGRGLMIDQDLPQLGTYLGLAGDEAVREAVEGSDLVLMLGIIVCDTNFGVSGHQLTPSQTVHAVDREVRVGHHTYANLPLPELVEALLSSATTRPAPTLQYARDLPAGLVEDEGPVTPLDIVRGINDLFRASGPMPVASDMGDCLFSALDLVDTDLVAPAYYASMGFGVPAGLGIQAATGRRSLVLVGDGAFQMTGWELGNARRQGLDPIVVLFNNRSWGMLNAFQPGGRFNDLEDWNYAQAADSLGGDGIRIRTRAELGAALRKAHDTRGRFQILDVQLQPGAVSPALQRFVGAVQRLSQPRLAAIC